MRPTVDVARRLRRDPTPQADNALIQTLGRYVRNASLLKEVFDEDGVPLASLVDLDESAAAHAAARNLAAVLQGRFEALLDAFDARHDIAVARHSARSAALQAFVAHARVAQSTTEVRVVEVEVSLSKLFLMRHAHCIS